VGATSLLPGISIVNHRTVEGKNAVIVGSRVAIALDCGADAGDAEPAAALFAASARASRYLVLTHGHGDHAFGRGAFPGVDVIAHARCAAVIEREVGRISGRTGAAVEEVRRRAAWPTIALDGGATIDLGDELARLIPAPGHSEDGLALYLTGRRVLFAGDSAVTAIVPAIGDGNSATLVATLGRLIGLEAEVLVPGHGEPVRGQDAVRAALLWIRSYLEGLRQLCAEALARGDDPPHIVAMAAYDRFCGERFPVPHHDMPRRHRATVQKILIEMTER